ncbi:hypothetical protein Pelo_16974 [Pelomyxa schiedti]|nr:hypothetical protein Pelo_16974 [Pelomyxa schiedti]
MSTNNTHSDDLPYVVTPLVCALEQMTALAMVPSFGAVVARIVWDQLVRDTPTTFVLHVQGKTNPEDESVCVCLRVSRLLGSLMPHTHIDETALSDGSQFGRWKLLDPRRHWAPVVAVVGDDPVNFQGVGDAANHKWVATCGWFLTEASEEPSTPSAPMLLTRRLNQGTFFSSEDTRVVVIPPAVVASALGIGLVRFSKSRADELLLVVNRPGEWMPSFVMVDVEATHSTGSLALISITNVVNPPPDCVPVFLLKRSDGSHTVIAPEEAPWQILQGMGCWGLEVEEGSGGNATKVPLVSLDCENMMQCSLLKGQVPILQNNINNDHPPPATSWSLLISDRVRISDDRGFIFHVNGSSIHVIESTSHCTVVTIEFKQFQSLTLNIKFSS